MSSLTQPRGPLPARVYWTRRLILLAVAALLLVTLARVLTGGSDGKTMFICAAPNFDEAERRSTTLAKILTTRVAVGTALVDAVSQVAR